MNSGIEAGIGNTADVQTFAVLGVLLQFLATPEQINDQICVMKGMVPPGVVIPLHSHEDPEIFYVLEGSLEVFQEEDASSPWRAVNAGSIISIPGNRRHALRNTSADPVMTITVSKQGLYEFFRELAQPFDPDKPYTPPTPEDMHKVFEAAAKHGYWLGSPGDNAAIGISLG